MAEDTKVEIQNKIENQAEVVTGAVSDDEYLSLDMLTSGTARNIITVRLTTQMGSFCVDVLKKNPLYRIMGSDLSKQRLEKSQEDDANVLEISELSFAESCELIMDLIVKPKLQLKNMKLYLKEEELPGDVMDLLLEAIDLVNTPVATQQAVQHFQESNGE